MTPFTTWLVSLDAKYELGARGIRVVVTILVAMILLAVARRSVPRVLHALTMRMSARGEHGDLEMKKRGETLGAIARSIAVLAIWVIALLMVLKELGFDIAPVLAGAGIVGLAVGFGAQNLVRDVISGGFMLLEDQVRVGDVAEVNGKGGLVERMNLRTIALRGLDGTLHVFANGNITTLANMTHEFSYYVFDVGVAYKEDVDDVMAVLAEIGEGVREDETLGPDVLAPLEILGVDSFADSAVIIKARIKTKPSRQWAVGRAMNRRIKMRFDEAGIEIPFPHRTIYFGAP